MATGRQPFYGESAAVIYDAMLNRDPAPAETVDPEMPGRLGEIISKALEKDRDLRYQHGAEKGSQGGRREAEVGKGVMAYVAYKRHVDLPHLPA